jgi:hypothetical protein
MKRAIRSPRRRVRVLRQLCWVLTAEDEVALASQGGSHVPPFAWGDVRALADELAVTSAVWGALRRRNLQPPERELLLFRQHHGWNTARNLEFRHRLTQAVEALNAAGIVPLLFKGSLSLVDGSVHDLGHRWMSDLDLAVPCGTLDAAVEALREVGYAPTPGGAGRHEFAVVRKGAPGPIEFHVELGSQPIPTVLPVSDAWGASSDLRFATAEARGLSPTHQVFQCILHSAVQDLTHAFAVLPMRQLLTLAHLVRAHGSAVDWSEIDRRAASGGLSEVVRDHVWLAQRMAGLPAHNRQLGGARPRVHELRVLANFSLGWPVDLRWNLRYAFGSEHLDELYHHGDRPWQLASARVRHAVRLLGRDWNGSLSQAFEQRGRGL